MTKKNIKESLNSEYKIYRLNVKKRGNNPKLFVSYRSYINNLKRLEYIQKWDTLIKPILLDSFNSNSSFTNTIVLSNDKIKRRKIKTNTLQYDLFTKIPYGILFDLLKMLNVEDVLKLSKLNKIFKLICLGGFSIWKTFLIRRYLPPVEFDDFFKTEDDERNAKKKLSY